MSDISNRRPRSHYSNNHHSWNTPDQQSPLPLLVPSFPQNTFHSPDQSTFEHAETPNNRPWHQHLEKHLPYRMWSATPYHEYYRQNHHQHFKLHILCYNILAQMLLEDNIFLYQNCFKNNLKWYRRRDRLLRELFRQDADIICLQEMQYDHYENDFRLRFLDEGYDSIYLKRCGDKVDGCCLFYKRNRLRLVQSKSVSFYQKDIRILDNHYDSNESEGEVMSIWEQRSFYYHQIDNCGLIALFQPLTHNATSDDLFCVATTHLLFSPNRGDIKLAQTQYFLAEIDRLATRNVQTNSYYPIILCGDFNAQPQSPLIQFLLNGHIQYNTYRCIEISGQTPDSLSKSRFSYPLPFGELLPVSMVTSDCRFPTTDPELASHTDVKQQSTGMLTHNKRFTSVYDLNDCLDVTTNAGDESKSVDYIFYTQQENDPYRLNLINRFNLYNGNDMMDIHLPNHQFASDHFLLGAKFALKLGHNSKQ